MFKREDYIEKLLRIKPEGWIDDLVFEYGYFHGSGQAESSIGIRINDEAGGVLTNDDLMAILNMIVAHFKRIAQEAEEQVSELPTEDLSQTEATPRRKR